MNAQNTLMDCNAQWASRPDDERFCSLPEMQAHFERIKANSKAITVESRALQVIPTSNTGLAIQGANGHAYGPSNWAFGQLSSLIAAPSGYLRTLPAPMAADCMNWGLQNERSEQVQVLLSRDIDRPAEISLRAATGPRYGRVWNSDVIRALVNRFGDGITGDFRVPGEFGKAIDVTKANTTLFAGDRDMFVFLADERNRIEVPGDRDEHKGFARGFFFTNSEVGAGKLGVKAFLFRYACCNRIVWGAKDVQEISIRHSSLAPERFVREVLPALQSFADASAAPVLRAIEHAKADRLADVDAFLAKRYGARMVEKVKAAHLADESRPIETRWDVVNAVTAHARTIVNQDARVDLETDAGELLTF